MRIFEEHKANQKAEWDKAVAETARLSPAELMAKADEAATEARLTNLSSQYVGAKFAEAGAYSSMALTKYVMETGGFPAMPTGELGQGIQDGPRQIGEIALGPEEPR